MNSVRGTKPTVLHHTGILHEGTPFKISLPATHILYGSIRLTDVPQTPVSISIGTAIWSEQKSTIPFQAICRGSTSLLVTGFTGDATYTYTAVPLR